MISKVYIFKSSGRHKTRQILFSQSTRNIEKQLILLYCSTSSAEAFANRNFGENSWKLLSRILFLVIGESSCSRNTWTSQLQKFLKI